MEICHRSKKGLKRDRVAGMTTREEDVRLRAEKL